MMCTDLKGFSVEDFDQEIVPWAKEVRQYYEDECSKKSLKIEGSAVNQL